MSHRNSCPDEYEARREGERAQERGYGRYSNPYDEFPSSREGGCREAEEAWNRGYRDAERRQEERQEEEASARRHAQRQQEEMECEEPCFEYPDESYPEPEPNEEMPGPDFQ